MAAFSHNGEPGSALDAELKGHDTRHREGYAAGFKAGREAGMREAAALLRRSEDRLIGGIRRVAAADRHTAYVLHNHADAILSAIEGAK